MYGLRFRPIISVDRSPTDTEPEEGRTPTDADRKAVFRKVFAMRTARWLAFLLEARNAGRHTGREVVILLAMALLFVRATAARSQVREGVTTLRGSRQRVEQWKVETQPLIALTPSSGAANSTEFDRIAGLARLSDGSIVVADVGSSELRYFDRAGRFVTKAAGKGSGPGEVNGFDGAHVVDDTVYAYDERGPAMVFDASGRFVRQVPIRNIGPRQIIRVPSGVLRGGNFVGVEYDEHRYKSDESIDSVRVMVVSRDGAMGRAIGRWPFFRKFRRPDDHGARPLGFTPQLAVAVFPTEICVGYSATYDIRCYDEQGKVRRQVSLRMVPTTVTQDMRNAYERGEAGVRADGSNKYEGAVRSHRLRMAQTMRYAEQLPVFARMLASRSGELWVSDFRPEDGMPQFRVLAPPVPSHWRVFDTRGWELGNVELPARFRPFDAGADWVLGVTTDADDTESVLLLRVRRP